MILLQVIWMTDRLDENEKFINNIVLADSICRFKLSVKKKIYSAD